MASDAINVLIHLNVLFSIRQKQDFSQGSVNDLNEQLVIVPVFLYNKINVMTDQIEII